MWIIVKNQFRFMVVWKMIQLYMLIRKTFIFILCELLCSIAHLKTFSCEGTSHSLSSSLAARRLNLCSSDWLISTLWNTSIHRQRTKQWKTQILSPIIYLFSFLLSSWIESLWHWKLSLKVSSRLITSSVGIPLIFLSWN